MAVYVDDLREYPEDQIKPAARNCGRVWCHMTADTREELHALARRIGMRRNWFQDAPILWHYDLTPSKRAWAVRLGAIERHTRELWVEVYEKRRKERE